jgi:signal peptidase
VVDVSPAPAVTTTGAEDGPGPVPPAAPGRRPARRARRLGDVLITVAGAIGIACVVAWLVARALGLSLVVLTTGSMSPTIPAGGVAVTRDAPAAELEVGDVVTVPRAGSDLPVTHRVVAIDAVTGDAVTGDAEARSLTLRGDANITDDRDPYVVREAARVVAAAPTGGAALAALASPTGRGVVVVLVGLSVMGAFWPARPTPRPTRRPAPRPARRSTPRT